MPAVNAATTAPVLELTEQCGRQFSGVVVEGSGFEPFEPILMTAGARRSDGSLYGPFIDGPEAGIQADENGDLSRRYPGEGEGPLHWGAYAYRDRDLSKVAAAGEGNTDCPVVPRPQISALYLSPDVFSRTRRPPMSGRLGTGSTAIHVETSEAVTIRFRVRRIPKGAGGKPPKKPRWFKESVPAGESDLPFSGWVGDLALRPAQYMLIAVARNAENFRAIPVATGFQIVPRQASTN